MATIRKSQVTLAASCLFVHLGAGAVAIANVGVGAVASGSYLTEAPPLAPLPILGPGDTFAISGAPPERQTDSKGGPEIRSGLVPGLTYFIDYAYTATVSDDGLIATGDVPGYCAPIGIPMCAASVGGREVAYSGFLLGFTGRDTVFPGTFVKGEGREFRTTSDAFPDFITDSGVLRITYGTTNPLSTSVTFTTFTTAFADGGPAPIPEPETYALMLAGLAGVGVLARTKRGSRLRV
jgi:hypothetical protein